MNKGLVLGGAIVLVVVALVAGAFLGPKVPFVANLSGSASGQGFADGRAGGPMGQLTDAERQQLQNMSDSERQAFFQKKFGSNAPAGRGGFGGPGGRSMTFEGEITDVASDSITMKTSDGGSRTVYYDDKTTLAYAKGAEQNDLAKGDNVIAIATPEADNVISASTIVVK